MSRPQRRPPAAAARERAVVAGASGPSLPAQMFAEAVRRQQSGETQVAEPLYRAILALHPAHAQASYNLGVLLHGQGRHPEAILAYRHAIALAPDYVDAYGNLGVALQDSGRAEDAVAVFRHVLAARPDFLIAAGNLGVALKMLGRTEEAEAAYRAALRIDPCSGWLYANLAALLLERGDNEAAMAACRQAIAHRPESELARFNLGAACKAMSRLEEAQAALRGAIALKPDFTEAHFTLGQVLLLQGAFAEGWAEYDWRWRLREYAWLRDLHGEFAQPLWDGEPLEGRRILVYAEQGMGDAIHFVRYVPRLAAMGNVTLAVHPPLLRLFEGLGVDIISLDQRPLPPFDVHCPLLSLPGKFGTRLDTIPADTGYLRPDPPLVARWRDRLPAVGPRVGMVWAGNPTQTGDRFRSPRLEAVRPLFEVPGLSFVALQVGPGRADLAQQGLPPQVVDLGAEITDFTDTAAIMAGLDLVISSCTAPLHLGGALAVPIWGMIPFAPHFPWMLDRLDTPWYPTMRLYRQAAPGADWSGVVDRIAGDLAALRDRAAAPTVSAAE